MPAANVHRQRTLLLVYHAFASHNLTKNTSSIPAVLNMMHNTYTPPHQPHTPKEKANLKSQILHVHDTAV